MCFRPAGAQAATKTCPSCGAENGYFDEICKECGEKLPESSSALNAPSRPKAPGAPGAPGRPAAPGAPKSPGLK